MGEEVQHGRLRSGGPALRDAFLDPGPVADLLGKHAHATRRRGAGRERE
jgi:hypothetical protein